MNHLEALAKEWLEWTGHIVKTNIRVGKRSAGGYEMEVDVVAFSPSENIIRHYELSLDAHSWDRRTERFEKKFEAARRYMFTEVFPFLPAETPIEQIAIFPNRREAGLAGGNVLSVDEFTTLIARKVALSGKAARAAIPEQFPLLRHTQFLLCGYLRRPDLS